MKLIDKQGKEYLVESVGSKWGIIKDKNGSKKKIPISYLLEECQRLDEFNVKDLTVVAVYDNGVSLFSPKDAPYEKKWAKEWKEFSTSAQAKRYYDKVERQLHLK